MHMNNETPKERGLITYFDIEQFGFYRLRQKKVGEPLDIDTDDLLLRLSDWLTGKQFQNTVPWGALNHHSIKYTVLASIWNQPPEIWCWFYINL